MALVSETSVKHKKGLKESNVSDQAVRRARAAEHCTKLRFHEILSVKAKFFRVYSIIFFHRHVYLPE